MAGTLIFPYPTLGDPVELEAYDPSVDGHRGEGVDIRERAIDVYDLGQWAELTLKVRVRVDGAALDAVASDPRVVVTVHCGPTNLRHAVVLERDGSQGSSFTGEVILERELLADRAELHAVVAGVVDGVADRFVGHSPVHAVNLRPPRSPDIAGDLDVQWRDFSDPTTPLPPELHDQASYLELEPVGKQAPVLWLNTNVSELPRLLDERSGRTPLERALRDVAFDTIAAPALLTMLHSAIAAARTAEPEWPSGWRRDVLHALLPLMMPDVDVEQALESVVTSPEDTLLQAAAHTAVARFLKSTRNTIHAIETLEKTL